MPESGAMTIMRCAQCRALDPGPREICPACHAAALEPCDVPGRGTLVSWTMIRRPPAQYRDDGAYAVAIVSLDAGVQVTGRLKDPSDSVRPGTRVRVVDAIRETVLFEADATAQSG